MNISISYNELHEYVERNFKKDVSAAFVDAKTVKITYRQKVLITSIPFSLNLKVLEVTPAAVTLQYNGGAGIDMIIAGVLQLMQEKLLEMFNAAEAVTVEKDHRIRIDFLKIKKAKPFFEKAAFRDIIFNESGVTVEITLL